jgi:hypothetical protein
MPQRENSTSLGCSTGKTQLEKLPTKKDQRVGHE